jgi:hypothetical protein
MKFVLIFLVCSVIDGKTNCMPPFQAEVEYVDAYECMIAGYTEAHDRIVALGRDAVNEYNIYIRFGCNENQFNKTPVSNIIVQ